ncbi:MAG: response regulator transcription factor [Alphaproteobacteria bacterium]|nr:response regulator transcription factor [Alphaproteobacteria bacterium]
MTRINRSRNKKHILVIDDDDRLRALLCRYLQENELIVTTSKDTAEARELMKLFLFDLLIVDIMMPGENGIDFTNDIRKYNNVPVLMLTAMGEPENRISGLESGADDYLSKPFEPRELLLRIRNILKRIPSAKEENKGLLKLGVCTYDIENGWLLKDGEKVKLTPAESALLKIFAEQAGQILTREDIIRKTGDENNPRTIDVQITRLRSKIETDPKLPRYLQTIRGKGYILLPD